MHRKLSLFFRALLGKIATTLLEKEILKWLYQQLAYANKTSDILSQEVPRKLISYEVIRAIQGCY
jgi:hypothetical protein